jgi:hypothetical protein
LASRCCADAHALQRKRIKAGLAPCLKQNSVHKKE